MCAKSLQSCLTLCDPLYCSPPGSSVHGILQATILKWVATSFSRVSSRPRDWTRLSSIYLHWQANSLTLAPPGKPLCLCGVVLVSCINPKAWWYSILEVLKEVNRNQTCGKVKKYPLRGKPDSKAGEIKSVQSTVHLEGNLNVRWRLLRWEGGTFPRLN